MSLNNLVGKWNKVWSDKIPIPLGYEITYKIGMAFLKNCNVVEDWGCANGYAKRYCKSPQYIGIDGSENACSNETYDLRYYTSSAEGIFMRHVLEHNPDWELILNNALSSYTKRFALIINHIVDNSYETKITSIIEDREIVNMIFKKDDLLKLFKNHHFIDFDIDTEHIFLFNK